MTPGDRFAGVCILASISAGLTLLATATPDGTPRPQVVALLVAVWAPTLLGWVGLVYRYRETNLGRADTSRRRWARRLARLVGYSVMPCGCTYVPVAVAWGSPNQPDADAVEETAVWLRRTTGERVRFHRVTEVLKRCHRCGRHYHDTDKEGVRHECWPEEEPAVVDDLDAPIREAAEVGE
jgi:hypothetical protein